MPVEAVLLVQEGVGWTEREACGMPIGDDPLLAASLDRFYGL